MLLKRTLSAAVFAVCGLTAVANAAEDTAPADLVAAAKAEGAVWSLAMPDAWAN